MCRVLGLVHFIPSYGGWAGKGPLDDPSRGPRRLSPPCHRWGGVPSFRAMKTLISNHRPVFGAFVFLSATLPYLSACAGEPPALTIGEVEYAERDLLGFTADRRTRLAEITALGYAVSRGEEGELGEALVIRRSQVTLLETLEREVALRLAGVEEDALEARYQSNPDHELTVRHLVLLVEEWASEEEEEEARSAAEEALRRIREGEDFGTVAGEVSEEPGAAERGGLLRPGVQGTWVPEFWNAANALEVGEVSPVIRTGYGFHILKLENRTPLPFSQGRYRVVQEVADLLPTQSEAIDAWVDSATLELTVDSAAIRRAWEEAGSLFSLAQKTLGEGDPDGYLATWDGGGFTRGQLRHFLLSLQRPSWEHVRSGGLAELYRVAGEGARRYLLQGIADSMGVSLPENSREAFRAEWVQTVAGWGAAMGFREGMTPEQVRVAALAAAASTAQGATIARQELQAWAPLLLSAYPIGPSEG